MIERDVVERRQPRVARVVIGFVGKVRQQRYRYQRPARIAVVENEDRALAPDILPMSEAADELRRREAIGKIGRAPCRASVCPYAKIEGDAVSLNKYSLILLLSNMDHTLN